MKLDFSYAGSELGASVARGVTRIEQSLGIAGWPLFCFTVAALVTRASEHGLPASIVLWHQLSCIAVFGVMLGASVLLRQPSRWLSELGFNLGLWSALCFCGLALGVWLFAPKSSESTFCGSAFILSAQFSAALCALAAWHDWEQVETAVFSVRRYINGANGGGERSAFESALEPLLWLALSLFAIAAALFPARVMHKLCNTRDAMPPVLMTNAFWTIVAALLLTRLYIAFRRVGLGYVERGFFLWLYSVGEFAGGAIVCAAIYWQFQPNDMNARLIACAVAFVAAGFAWFCDHRRRDLTGR